MPPFQLPVYPQPLAPGAGIYNNPGAGISPVYPGQQTAYEAEQERQRQIALQQQKGSTGIQTEATKQIAEQSNTAQMQRLQQQLAGQQSLQQSQYAAMLKQQQEAEAAQAGLQAAGFQGQSSLQQAQLQGEQQRQKEAEQAQSAFLAQQGGLAKSADERHYAALQGLLSQTIGGVSGIVGPGGLPGVVGAAGGGGYSGAAGGGIAGQEDAARQAAFARAKDQAGLIGRSAVNSLQNVMGGRGLVGSSIGGQQAAGVINQGATQLGDVNREQAIQDLQNARQRASEQYQGAITQRGQNLGLVSGAIGGLLGSRAY